MTIQEALNQLLDSPLPDFHNPDPVKVAVVVIAILLIAIAMITIGGRK